MPRCPSSGLMQLSFHLVLVPDVVHLDHLHLDDNLDFLWHPRFKSFVSSVVVNVAAVVVIDATVVVIVDVIVVAVVVESLVGLAKVRYYQSW
ncbi:hypothetical protein Tco_0555831 [Tanacetum coccineum]